jgi:hypothetical protein
MAEARVMANMKILFEDSDGVEIVYVEDGSQEASMIGRYWHDMGEFLAGEIPNLDHFDGLEINGRYVMTDLDDIEELAAEDALEFDDIYEE